MAASDRKLKNWRISFTKSSFAVLVEGYLENDSSKQLWRTSKIERCEDSRILYTKTGQRYILVGSINRTASLEKNFSTELIKRFSHGFPEDWQHILSKHYHQITENSNTPIRASKHTIQRLQKKILSSSEDEDEQEEKEIRPVKEKSKKRKIVHGVPVVPSKKTKKNAPSGTLALRKLRENYRQESPDFDVEMVVEPPKSDTSADATANKENYAIKKWTQVEKQKLLERLKVMNPVNEADWEDVQRCKTDVFRSIDELKNKAKELNWKPIDMNGQRVDLEQASTLTIKEITARPGTVDYMMQAEQANRDYVVGKSKALKNVSNLPIVSAPLDLDDSIISMIRTPENPKRIRFHFQPVPRAYSSFASDMSSTLDESNVSGVSISSNSFMEQDEKAKKRHQRNNFQILKKQAARRANPQMSVAYSMADEDATLQSLFPPPNIPMQSGSNYSTLEEEYDEDEDLNEEFDENCEI